MTSLFQEVSSLPALFSTVLVEDVLAEEKFIIIHLNWDPSWQVRGKGQLRLEAQRQPWLPQLAHPAVECTKFSETSEDSKNVVAHHYT